MSATELTLLHTNDMHNRRMVFPYLEEHPKGEHSLLVDVGDAIHGSNTMFYLHEPMLDLMNRAGYDAMAMGNREFHYARGVLCRRIRQARFPVLCGNVCDLRHRVNHAWRRSIVRDVGGVRVGLIGVTPVQYPDDSLWKPVMGFRFSPPAQVLPELVRELRPRVDLIVLLSHLGFKLDCRLAGEIAGIDIIAGGHCHAVLQHPHRVGDTVIVQAGSHGRFVGRMQVRVGSDGSVDIRDYVLVPMAGAGAGHGMDPEAQAS